MKQKIYFAGIVSAIVLISGTMFKVNHWPAAGILLCTGTLLLLAIFIPAALMDHYKAYGDKQSRLLYIVTYVTCFVIFISMLIKIMHWPFTGYLILVALPFPFIVFLPVWLYVTSKIKNFDINNTIFILLFLSMQAVFSAFLALNVARDKIDASLGLSANYSSLNKLIDNIPDGGTRSAVITSADELLIQIDECRQMLYNRTGTNRSMWNGKATGNRYLDSRSVAGEVLLWVKEPTPAMKLETCIRNFAEELGKIPGSADLAQLTLDLFDLTTIENSDLPWDQKMFAGNYLAWVMISLDAAENYTRVIKLEVME
jgi:hypothetical protein